jgi:pyruvate carboxylase
MERITAYRSPAGFGVRLDAGTAYPAPSSRATTIRCWSRSRPGRRRREETIARMHRALWEFRIRGVVTNLRFLDQLIMHPRFASFDYTTKFIDETPGIVSHVRASATVRRGC